jgi:hypothetical protein
MRGVETDYLVVEAGAARDSAFCRLAALVRATSSA